MVTFCGLQPGNPFPNTRYTKTTAPGRFIPTVVDGDHSLPVELSAFTATRTSDGVFIRWRTESETNNLGFDLYRVVDGKGVNVNAQIVHGHGTTGTPHEYQLLDAGAPEGVVVKYYLEDIDLTGNRNRSPVITVTSPRPVQLVTWGRIKARR